LDTTALRLAAVIESSDDAVISQALDGTIQTWNRSAERMFGYSAAEAVGHSIELIIPSDRRPEERTIIAQVLRGDAVAHFETAGIAKSGTMVPISVSISPILTPDGNLLGISRIARDLSQQKALEREAFRLAAVVDSSVDAIVSKDLNGVVQTWNKSAERMFGYRADEIIGKPITLIIPDERRAEEDTVLGRIRAGLTVEHFETVRRRKDGTPIEISLSVSPIRTSTGTIIGASKIARDITVQRQLARDAEEANRIKDEFLAMLSHELRTPLNAVLGYTRMLRMPDMDEARQARAIDVIERNAQILSQLVSDVLDISRIVTGKMEMKLAGCDVAEFVCAAADIVRPSADSRGVALKVTLPQVPVWARCDADRMQQVLWNLLTNAVKFTPRGGRIDVAVTHRGDTVEIDVQDTGLGIPPDALPLVFQRFWQGDNNKGRPNGGLGLGLALARHFVELHGGTITAASEGEGRGATFTVSLPASAN
jgi:PAS domain S-box-containing protein